MVTLAEEHAVGPQASPDEARILDQHAVKAHDFIEGKGIFAGLKHSAAPSLQPTARRTLAFDLKARPAVGQQQKAGRTRHDMGSCPADNFNGLIAQLAGGEVGERLRPEDQGTKCGGSKQVGAQPVSAREARRGGEVSLRIKQVDRADAFGIRNIQCLALEEFIEEPCAAVRRAGRRAAREGRDGLWWRSVEDPLEDEQVEVFMTQREGQMVAELFAGPVSLVENDPAPLLPATRLDMLLRDNAWPPQRG